MSTFIFNAKQLKMNKLIKYIWQFIISILNPTLEVPSLLPCLDSILFSMALFFDLNATKFRSVFNLVLLFISRLVLSFNIVSITFALSFKSTISSSDCVNFTL